MFFFEFFKVKLEFECSVVMATEFENALKELNMNKNEALEEFIQYTIAKAKEKEEDTNTFENKLTNEQIESRIKKWANNCNGKAHKMLKAYFRIADIFDGEFADKLKMQYAYNDITGQYEDSDFINVFRQMCSASQRAYGDVFIYDRREHKVYLNEKYRDQILELRNEFLN